MEIWKRIKKLKAKIEIDISKANKKIINTDDLSVIKKKSIQIKNLQTTLLLLERTNIISGESIIKDLEYHYEVIDWCLYQLKEGLYMVDGTDILEKLHTESTKASRLEMILKNVFDKN
jgi:hypothetical protein